MKRNRAGSVLVTVLAALVIAGLSPAQDGKKVATVDKVSKNGEIIIKSGSIGRDLQMGTKVYVRVDDGIAVMTVEYPMQTIAKCSLQKKNKRLLPKIKPGMEVFRYSPEIEESAEGVVDTASHGEEKSIGGITFVYIKGGSFMMGSPDGKGIRNEYPYHKVTLDGFWIGKFEITQKQYEEIMGSNPSTFTGKNNPVESVSWFDTQLFCTKFGDKHKVRLRLPTEAEWEYACRAGSTTYYYWGDTADGGYAWYDKNSGGTTHPVGGKKPNAWGLYDMCGNVREWCEDWASDKYQKSPGKNPKGAAQGGFRILRGGASTLSDSYLRSAYRSSDYTNQLVYYNGFRVVLASLTR